MIKVRKFRLSSVKRKPSFLRNEKERRVEWGKRRRGEEESGEWVNRKIM
ncbi:MAG: hypothetical protein GYA41_00640 [Bacteroidales bacterium]|nr:hypothetical protein [Bacteroidales bacterium]